jgi:hypothetical protein
MSDSAGIPHKACSRQIILSVSRCLRFKTSDTQLLLSHDPLGNNLEHASLVDPVYVEIAVQRKDAGKIQYLVGVGGWGLRTADLPCLDCRDKPHRTLTWRVWGRDPPCYSCKVKDTAVTVRCHS